MGSSRDSDQPTTAPAHSFWQTVAWTLVIWVAFVGSGWIGARVAERFGDPTALRIVSKGIAPAFVGVIATTLVLRKLGSSWRHTGLQPASTRCLGAGVVASLPLLIAYALIFGPLGVSAQPVPYVGLVVAKFFVAQGIAEEVIFRGFVFGRLRRGRSFARAATLSAVVFALVHLSNFLNGFSEQVVIGVVTSTIFAFVLAYPAALLFERTGYTIWPFAITHVFIDSINWFEHVSVPGPGLLVYLLAVLLTAAWTFVLARRLSPAAPDPHEMTPLPRE